MKIIITISTIVSMMLSGCNGKTTCEDTAITDAIKQSVISKIKDNQAKLKTASEPFKHFFSQDDKINIDTLQINSRESTDGAALGALYVAENMMKIMGGDQALECSYNIKDTSVNKYVKLIPEQNSYYKYTDSDALATYAFICFSSENHCIVVGQ